MNDSQSVIGFTEAELGFFLAALCVVLYAVGLAAQPAPGTPPPTVEISADSLEELQRNASYEDSVVALKDSIDTLNEKYGLLPNCSQRGIGTGPILTVVVLGAASFRVQNDTLGVPDVAALTSEASAEARAASCVHEIEIEYIASLSAQEYQAGRSAIAELGFRTRVGRAVGR